jgi:hypothetical protein
VKDLKDVHPDDPGNMPSVLLGAFSWLQKPAQMHSGTVWELIREDQTSGTSGTSGDEWDESVVFASHSSGLSRKSDEWNQTVD